ncbi:hypothetical protein BI375_14105 [Vibrio rotiferianus]|uniref:Right handed beta helix domain-containing protein n=1 Tax=Vibrio rotiferianus TaxID=190895 RepID=A0ABX3DDX6_9VIBR|nr:hypothetical protein [Vibrio rotiferianus]OHY95382.1 hypothetical protein BI375_14105 [Vibrio rotiferianus]
MESVNNWLKCFDEIKESKIKPFKDHVLSGLLNDHELNSYAVLQSAFVLFNGNLSENQERLYKFYLPALSKDLKLSEIVSQAQSINDEKLNEYIKLLEDKAIVFLFLLDVLVFARLDNTLTDEFKSVLNSFCYSLSLSGEEIEQVVYLCDCILGIEIEKKPELLDLFFEMIKNPIWIEFFSKPITKNNIFDIKNGIWCIDEPIELLDGDISWKNSVIIFDGFGRLDHFNGYFISDNTHIISPVIKTNDVTIYMESVDIKGEYKLEEKITAIDINASEKVVVKNSKVKTVNARAFSFCQHSTSGWFENTDFVGCGNENLLGGAVKFIEKAYFKNCNFNDCKAKVGGALFFKTSYQDNIVDCNFKNCLSITVWGENINAGAIYFQSSNSYNMSCIVSSNIQGDISIYTLDSHSSYKQTIVNSYLSGLLFYYNYANNSGHINMLDNKSQILSGVNDSYGKNHQSNEIEQYDSLIIAMHKGAADVKGVYEFI